MTTGETHAFDTFQVQLRQLWADEWATVPNLRPLTAALAVSPSVGRAEFEYHFGDIRRETDTAFVIYDPLVDYKDWFIRIVRVEQDLTLTTLWIGVVKDEQVPLAHPAGVTPLDETGDQILTAFELTEVLDRVPIYQAIVQQGLSAVQTETVPVFNERHRRGLTIFGNRSNARHLVQEQNIYIFSKDAEDWTTLDIVEYLLVFAASSGVPFDLVGHITALDDIIPTHVSTYQQTTRGAYNSLMDRRRGFGWTVRYDDVLERAQIHVFTVFKDLINIGANQIPGNAEQATFQADSRHDIETLNIREDSTVKYDWVVALGARIKSCFTLSFIDGTLQEHWSTQEETDYKTAGGGTAEERDRIRLLDIHSNVYREFIARPEWNWASGDGDGGFLGGKANPAMNDDGTFDPANQGGIRDWGIAPLRNLPVLKTYPDTIDEIEFLEPLALIKDADSGTWHHLEHLSAVQKTSGSVRMLDNALGVAINMHGPPHVLAKGSFDPSTETTQISPQLDYHNLVLTVSVELDSRLTVVRQINTGQNTPTGRILTIEIPDAEAWWIASQTVTGVDTNGLVKFSGANELRNDRDQLVTAATLAQDWYSQARQAVHLELVGIVETYKPGSFLTVVTISWTRETIGSIVTSVFYDFLKNRTIIDTGFEELDFANII